MKIEDKISEFSYKTYFIKNSEIMQINNNEQEFENNKIKVNVNIDGSIDILKRSDKKKYKSLGILINHADLGNEYMFGELIDDKNLTLNSEKSILKYENYKTYKLCTLESEIVIPRSAIQETFEVEKLQLKAFYNRETKRENKLITIPVKIIYTLENDSNFVKINIKFKNTAMDHRFRIRFNLEHSINEVNVDSIFDVVKRPVSVSKFWKHTSNDQQLSKFISVKQEENTLIIATKGLHEYEAKTNYLDITLLRSISEMGDWGYFPTPGAQLLEKELSLELAIGIFFDEFEAFDKGRYILNDTVSTQVEKFDGFYSCNESYIKLDRDYSVSITSLKRNFDGDNVLRLFSMKASDFSTNKILYSSSILEKKSDELFLGKVKNREIKTLIIGDE